MSRPALVALALVAASCGNAYVYRTTRLVVEPPRPPAQPALTMPASAREVGLVEALLDYGSGGGGEGMHDSEADFYPRLAALAGALGGTHFVILRLTRAPSAWITSITAAVFDTKWSDER